MGENSDIQWTDHTFNPWEGCQRVSPGCEHCYAETRNARFHPRADGGPSHWGPRADRLMRSPAYWKQPEKWNREAKRDGGRRRVFCASLSDVFEDRPELVSPRARLFRLIEECDALDWLLLTKRPENMLRLAAVWCGKWPANVWAGTTVEDQRRADERIPELLRVPAVVRFLSCEPLLEAVDVSNSGIDWIIVGGESGRGARDFHLDWADDIVKQCRGIGAAPFVKQMGAVPFNGDERFPLRDSHGGDWDEWPAELRVREFPQLRRLVGR